MFPNATWKVAAVLLVVVEIVGAVKCDSYGQLYSGSAAQCEKDVKLFDAAFAGMKISGCTDEACGAYLFSKGKNSAAANVAAINNDPRYSGDDIQYASTVSICAVYINPLRTVIMITMSY